MADKTTQTMRHFEGLQIVAEWLHMSTQIWVNIGSGNGLLPGGTKTLPEPMLTNHQPVSVTPERNIVRSDQDINSFNELKTLPLVLEVNGSVSLNSHMVYWHLPPPRSCGFQLLLFDRTDMMPLDSVMVPIKMRCHFFIVVLLWLCSMVAVMYQYVLKHVNIHQSKQHTLKFTLCTYQSHKSIYLCITIHRIVPKYTKVINYRIDAITIVVVHLSATVNR